MRTTKTAMTILVALVLTASMAAAAEDATQSFVNGLFQRFAYREPTAREMTYWTEKVHALTPEAAETHLKNYFFVHAAYKTICDRTVTIDEVESMVDMLNNGQLTYQSVQWSLFHSDEYKLAKAQGRVGKLMNPAANPPL
ncbi:MAG: hypothetical protein HY814_05285 [Candidatus Riflebacteria bacterium]|nr:hypothetical protein [Candidatus Riflebacteria bacterium]